MAKMVVGGIGDALLPVVFTAENRVITLRKVMKENEYILLLSKRLSGDINAEESAVLDAWLRQSPENQRFASDMQEIWKSTEGYGKTFSPNLEADFSKVKARLQQAPAAPMRATLSRRLIRAAAMAVLCLGAVWTWQQFGAEEQIIVSADKNGVQNLLLPDGSRVWLREGGQLSYSKKWSGSNRQVSLHGEGYFEVAHDPAHPFRVGLENGGSVEVLGTQFDVCQNGKQTSVLVRSGKVRFSPAPQMAGPVLTAQQKAVFEQGGNQVKVTGVSSLNDLSWQTGGLEFEHTPLHQVVTDLEKYYGVKISLKNPAMSNCPHSAPLTNQPIEKVLETLSLVHGLEVKKTGEKEYELGGGTCN